MAIMLLMKRKVNILNLSQNQFCLFSYHLKFYNFHKLLRRKITPAETHQHSLPNLSHLKTEKPLKKKLVSIDNGRQPSRNLPSNRRSKRQLSNQANPFDPLNIPSIGLPAVK